MNYKAFAALVTLLASTLYVSTDSDAAPPASQQAPAARINDDDRIAAAFRNRLSDIVVETSGVVTKLLPDDHRGSRHQRFILRLPSGHTVLVSHNIDLAPRIDGLRAGDAVNLRGEYEWNRQGGVIHWTHHDPKGGRSGGWIRHRGRVYE